MKQKKDSAIIESWITKYWSSSSTVLIEKYRKQDMKIECHKKVARKRKDGDYIVYSFNICK